MRRLEAEEKEMKQQNGQIDQLITTTMSEMQRLEAKKANLEHSLTRMDEDITVQKSRLESKQKHVEKIENEMIPPVEREIESLLSQAQTLQDGVCVCV